MAKEARPQKSNGINFAAICGLGRWRSQKVQRIRHFPCTGPVSCKDDRCQYSVLSRPEHVIVDTYTSNSLGTVPYGTMLYLPFFQGFNNLRIRIRNIVRLLDVYVSTITCPSRLRTLYWHLPTFTVNWSCAQKRTKTLNLPYLCNSSIPASLLMST